MDEDIRLLLVDEAQHLNDGHLDELRPSTTRPGSDSSSPATPAFAAASTARNRPGSRSSPRASRRGWTRKTTTAEDVEALAVYSGVIDPKAVAWLKKRCVGAGGLRMLMHLINLAKDMGDKGEVRLAQIEEAAIILRGAAK